MYDGQFCEFCDKIYQDLSSLTKHIRREHPYHYEEAVFEYFDLAIEISNGNFQIGIELITIKSEWSNLRSYLIEN